MKTKKTLQEIKVQNMFKEAEARQRLSQKIQNEMKADNIFTPTDKVDEALDRILGILRG